MSRSLLPSALAAAVAAALATVTAPAAFAQTAVATYLFNGNLNAQEGGAPALSLINPVGGSTTGFVTQNVTYNGVNNGNRTVLHLDGNNSGGQNAGLQLNPTGLITGTNYSIETVFQFSDRASAYRKILDVSNLASDGGFYVNPSNVLGVFSDVNPNTGPAWTNGTYFHVILTQSGGNVAAYLNGVQALTGVSTTMNLTAGNLFSLFLDDNATGNGEYSDSTVAYLRLYSGAVSAGQASTLASSTLPGATATVPEPGSLALLFAAAAGSGGVALVRVRRRSRA